jgi:hypothetical protein
MESRSCSFSPVRCPELLEHLGSLAREMARGGGSCQHSGRRRVPSTCDQEDFSPTVNGQVMSLEV